MATARKKPAKKTAARKAVAKRPPEAHVAAPPPAPAGSRLHVLDVPFEARSTVTTAGARWDAAVKAFLFEGPVLPARLAPYASKPWSWFRWREDDLNNADSAPAFATMETVGRPVLHAHQQEAVNQIVEACANRLPGFLLADDVGLGKTYAAVAGILALKPRRVLILAPLSVVPHWRRSISALADADDDTRWCVINYDRAKALLREPDSAKAAVRTRTKNKRTASQGVSLVPWDVVVADEAHLLRNPQAQRSAAVRRLIGEGSPSQAFVLWLSATAGQNPLQLSYLAPLLGAATGNPVKNLAEFEEWAADQGIRVTRGAFGKWEWERNDSDLSTLRRLLFDGAPPVGLRRRPTDIAGWPEQQRIPWPVDLEPDEQDLYEQAWTEFRREMQLARRGKDPANGLAVQLRFRQKASLLRATGTVGLVEDLIDNERQVAVSVQFLETADALCEQLGAKGISVARIDGSMTADEREVDRIAFQTGDAQVIVFTVTEGVSLHAGEVAAGANAVERAMIIHDIRYSALDQHQIEGRTHRDGQNAIAYYAFAEGTIEEQIVSRTIDRLSDMATMLGDDTTWVAEMTALLDGFEDDDSELTLFRD